MSYVVSVVANDRCVTTSHQCTPMSTKHHSVLEDSHDSISEFLPDALQRVPSQDPPEDHWPVSDQHLHMKQSK
jgi:hypothetical protein